MNKEIDLVKITEVAKIPSRFRPGESGGRAYGGIVANEPFAQALYSLARSRGYETQRSLAKALG